MASTSKNYTSKKNEYQTAFSLYIIYFERKNKPSHNAKERILFEKLNRYIQP